MKLNITGRTIRQLSRLFGIKRPGSLPTHMPEYWPEFLRTGVKSIYSRTELPLAYALWVISNNIAAAPKLEIDFYEMLRNIKIADRLSYLRDYLQQAIPVKHRRYTRVHVKPVFERDAITGCPLLTSLSVAFVIRIKDSKFIFSNSRKLFHTKQVPYTIRHNLSKRKLSDLIHPNAYVENHLGIRISASDTYVLIRHIHHFDDVLCCHEKLAGNIVEMHALNKMRSW